MDQKPEKCEKCEKRFSNKQALNLHSRVSI